MQVTLINTFHGTSATVRPVAITEGRFAGMHKISRKTALRLRSELCGSAGCTCGGNFGERGGALEIDDVLVELTPKEVRTLAGMFGGEMNSLLDIESSSHYLVRVAEVANQVRELQRVVTALRSGTGSPDQLRLDGFHS